MAREAESTMAEVLLFHHAQGLTSGVLAFAAELRRAGHLVHTPDLYEGNTFDNLDDGVGFASRTGFDTIMDRGMAAAEGLGAGLVYAGFSLGVMPAQRLAQTRPGAHGALLFSSCLPVAEFGDAWPLGVPVQVHGMDGDAYFAGEGDIDAARGLVAATDGAELFVYPGTEHLFADSSLPAYDKAAASLMMDRVLNFLSPID
jgi:dienelactone hydrolase